MEWNLIERKWEEMTRRVQPSLLTGRTSPVKVGSEDPADDLPESPAGLAASSLIAKIYE